MGLESPSIALASPLFPIVVYHYPETYGQKTGYHHIPSIMIENKCDNHHKNSHAEEESTEIHKTIPCWSRLVKRLPSLEVE